MPTPPAPATPRLVMISLDDTLRQMKAELRREFGKTTFSVRRATGTGTGYVSVQWTDGPTITAVRAICDGYQGSTFDGLQDLELSTTQIAADADGNPIRIQHGTRGIHCTRDLSDAAMAGAIRHVLGTRADADVSDARVGELLALSDAALRHEASGVRFWDTFLTTLARRDLERTPN